MTRPSLRRVLPLLAVLIAGAITSYALASPSPPRRHFTPTVSCQPTGLLRVAGRAPAATSRAYLVFPDGASVSAQVTAGRYSFLLAAQLPNGAPDVLRLVDTQGRIHDLTLTAAAFADCPARPSARQVRYGTAPTPRTPTGRAIALLNEATEIAQRTSPACGPGMVPPPHVTISNGSPPPAMLAVLGVLRRAQTAADRIPHSQLTGLAGGPPGVVRIDRRYTRIVHEPGGITARIIVGTGQESLPKSALYPCVRAAGIILIRLLRGQPPAVRRIALKFHRAYKLGPQTKGAHPWLSYAAAGGAGGPFDVRFFRAHGLTLEGCGTMPPPGVGAPNPTQQPRLECDLNGLVPDGVATVTLKLAGQARTTNLFGRPSAYYRLHPYTRTIPVIDNAWAFAQLPADPTSAAHQTLIWRDRSGQVLKTQSPV